MDGSNDMQLRYPDEPDIMLMSQEHKLAHPQLPSCTEVPLTENQIALGVTSPRNDLPEAVHSLGKHKSSEDEDQMQVDSHSPEEALQEITPEDVVMGEAAPEEEGVATEKGDVAVEPITNVEVEYKHEADASGAPPQPETSAAPVRAVPHSPTDLEPPQSPRKVNKTLEASQASLFIPKKRTSSFNESSSDAKRPRLDHCGHGELTKAKFANWTNTARPESPGPKALHTAARPPTLQRSQRGRPRGHHQENYRIQDDKMAKHPEQKSSNNITDKLADRLVVALSGLLEIIPQLESGNQVVGFEEAVQRASSPFDDFDAGKDMIKVERLKNRPDMLDIVARFAHLPEGSVAWPLKVRALKERAISLHKTWHNRLDGASSSDN